MPTRQPTKKKPAAPPSATPEVRKRPRWRVLSDEELKLPGAPVLALLIEAANVQGYSLREFALDVLGVSPAYFSALRSGKNPIPKMGEPLIERIAAFLQLPKIAVMLAAGQLGLRDFYLEPKAVDEVAVLAALRFMQNDSRLGPLMPPSIFRADPALQHFAVLLYEEATGAHLLPSLVKPEEIVSEFTAWMGTIANKGGKRS